MSLSLVKKGRPSRLQLHQLSRMVAWVLEAYETDDARELERASLRLIYATGDYLEAAQTAERDNLSLKEVSILTRSAARGRF